ncbi:MAG: sn-glycerol-3-phosphate ABC transporter ATP-binding protein UgpC [Candidatus Omnitrophica bacterium]|nr:sn-glycerol-3-phosphate ABC transporter ATP-binding protein UgpC [Candidatus Omnitrophota bacterium]MCF7894752.1 sn-glycerol-3-phosphate ABC transporter ATP-binding protein UgpC [Candidatus Omnitrophota bacterium]
MAEVQFKNINKAFGADVIAVSDLSLEIKDKEFVVLLGPSGCGKSTTLRMLAGLETPTFGDILIGDKKVNDMPAKDRDIAMVFQNYALYPHMNIRNNLAFALKLRRYSRDEIKKRVKEAADILGIGHLLDRKPKEISGGERQRVAVGRAIVRKPQAFLFDEPLSNLDAKLRVQMRTEIKKLHIKIKSTMVYVTHDQTEAMTLGDRVAIMKNGKLFQFDTPLNVYDKPANKFVAGFIGSPPMNFIEGVLRKKDDSLYFLEKDGFQIKVPEQKHQKLQNYIEKEIVLGIRPENLYDKLFASYATVDNTIDVTCDVIETMGSQNHLYLATKNHTIVAVVDASNKPAVGSRVEIVFDTKKIHFFDPSKEDTIV